MQERLSVHDNNGTDSLLLSLQDGLMRRELVRWNWLNCIMYKMKRNQILGCGENWIGYTKVYTNSLYAHQGQLEFVASLLITLVLYEPQNSHLWYIQWKREVPFRSQSWQSMSCIAITKMVNRLELTNHPVRYLFILLVNFRILYDVGNGFSQLKISLESRECQVNFKFRSIPDSDLCTLQEALQQPTMHQAYQSKPG